MQCLLIDVGRFLEWSGMSATAFGRQAVGDPRFVWDLRKGRQCGDGIRTRVYGFIAEQEKRADQCD